MYKNIILCMLINFGWCSLASEKSVDLVKLFPTIKPNELCNATAILLQGGVDPNYRPSIGHLSPLMWAMKNNNQELAWVLLIHGANPYHVVTSMPQEQCWSIETNLCIAFNTPWRRNSFMMGNEKSQAWLNDYVKGFKQRERKNAMVKKSHS